MKSSTKSAAGMSVGGRQQKVEQPNLFEEEDHPEHGTLHRSMLRPRAPYGQPALDWCFTTTYQTPRGMMGGLERMNSTMIDLPWMRAVLLGFACLVACTDDGTAGDEAADGPCVPNQSVPCTCTDGGNGAQICEQDGSAFGPCECAGTDDDLDGDTTGDGDTGWDGESTPSWSQHIVPLLYQSCGAGINGCHSREAYAAAVDSDCRGWLTLEDEALGAEFYAGADIGQPTGCSDMMLHDRLVTLAPWQCAADSRYVTPGSAEASYVWQKIQGQNLCEVSPGVLSKAMPPPDSGIVLSEMDEQMIEAWILAGAPNDN
jgi:hypothetical protein